MVMDPAAVHGDMRQQIRHRLVCGEWVRLGEAVDLHEDVPGASAMLPGEGHTPFLEFLATVSGDHVHDAVTIGDGGFRIDLPSRDGILSDKDVYPEPLRKWGLFSPYGSRLPEDFHPVHPLILKGGPHRKAPSPATGREQEWEHEDAYPWGNTLEPTPLRRDRYQPG
jgi:hypothetical protein